MSTNYNLFCDDFYVDMNINTQLDLPGERDTLLAFFERISKQFPDMTNFYRRDNGDFCLESDREKGSNSWVTIELERMTSGYLNPEKIDHAKNLNLAILDLAPHMLGLSYLDIASMDLSFSMDFDFRGNHNEVIAEALYKNSSFTCLLENPESKPISLPSGFIIAMDENCRTQAKLSIESNSSIYEIKTNRYKENEPITLNFTLRQYPSANEKFDSVTAYNNLFQQIQNLMDEKIIENFVYPLTNTIAQKR